MAIKQDRLREYARLGARVRASELEAEIKAIYQAFPELRSGARGSMRARSAEGTSTNGRAAASDSSASAPAARRRAPKWSAAARRAVSLRMKKYWADRRRAKS